MPSANGASVSDMCRGAFESRFVLMRYVFLHRRQRSEFCPAAVPTADRRPYGLRDAAPPHSTMHICVDRIPRLYGHHRAPVVFGCVPCCRELAAVQSAVTLSGSHTHAAPTQTRPPRFSRDSVQAGSGLA